MSEGKDVQKMEKKLNKSEELNKELQDKIKALQSENQKISEKCQSIEKELDKVKTDSKEKELFIKKVDELSHRICRIIEEKKDNQEKYTESLTYDRDFFRSKISELSADLQIAKESVEDLKRIIHMQEQEKKDEACKFACEMEKLKKNEQDALEAAGDYFHTYFPSIKSLKDHCQMNPVVNNKPTQKSKPFTPFDADVVHKNDEKKIKKQICKIHCLKRQLEDAKQSSSCFEALNMALTSDNEKLRKELCCLKCKDETSCLKLELEKSQRQTKELEASLQRNIASCAEKEANHRNEIAKLQQQIEVEIEKSQKTQELKTKINEQRLTIENHKLDTKNLHDKINHLTDLQAQQVVQIAKLEAENVNKDEKISSLKSKIKSLTQIPATVEVQPKVHWDQVSSPEIPKDLQKGLAEIIENNLMPIEPKIKSILKTTCAYYSAHQQNLEQFQQKFKTKFHKQQKSMASFIAELGRITLNRVIDFEEFFESNDIQSDMMTGVKKLISNNKNLEVQIRQIQNNLPYDQISILNEKTKAKEQELEELKQQNKNLMKQITKRMVVLSFQTNEIFQCENDAKVLHENIQQKADQINEFENQIKVLNETKSSVERKFEQIKKHYNESQSKLFGCQKEIERLKKTISDKEFQISELNKKLRNKTVDDITVRVKKANKEREFLVDELHKIKNENEMKLEYENTISCLKERVKFLQQELDDIQNGQSSFNQLNEILREIDHGCEMTQNEISILREQNSIVPDKLPSEENSKVEEFEKMKAKLIASEEKASKLEIKLKKIQKLIPKVDKDSAESSEKIKQLEEKVKLLQKQIEDERKSFISKVKEAKLESIKEYKVLVDQLSKRCSNQKNTIEALSKELKVNRRA
ncbi:hypothetical protein TRFO_33965 [Tritrichomonas foetus]|uniref:Uncharacterized protein n=1 Tax=Tritrichomonas foetus TaxID=1144522 RepID=A0A1J4JPW0_9EUKA|nr:hypothetical protein TRFO_33965 [Tritrichomonas foetus]|eukprot:OHS99555.1 hypothetical protein TRFO_33965 [Tritrichomonas foetus]